MAEQYWIGGFFVDASRNQITQNKKAQSLPPKALAVLTYLAENQGLVVSQDELLSHVWKDTIVSPNTLQRCIAQLRKALGDDGKVQSYIKTHAKRGYSLECDVRWQVNNLNGRAESLQAIELTQNTSEVASEPSGSTHKKPSRWLTLVMLSAVVLVFGTFLVKFFTAESEAPFSIKNITPLTSTDNRELASIYSPDGKYVVFKRYPEVLCINNLWAKNIETQEEYKLTEELGSYEGVSFSSDGQTLLFIKKDDCDQPVMQKSCYQLQSLDFQQGLNSPQVPSTIMECKNSEIRSASWINQDEITLLQKSSNRWQLISYSVSASKSNTIYDLEDGNIIAYDYSAPKNLIALTSIHSDGKHYIETLNPNGSVITSNQIRYPREISKFRSLYPKFSTSSDQLIFSTGRQLFALSLDGQVSNLNVPLDEPIGSPVSHPDGKRMLAIKGYYDSDIMSVPLSQFADVRSMTDSKNLEYTVLERSILGESFAKYQPYGDLIAFGSQRSGNSQVWVTNGENTQQISQLPLDTYVKDLTWATDGASVLANVSFELKQFYLDGRETEFDFEHPVSRLFHWDSEKHTALANILVQGIEKFVEINLLNFDVRVINDVRVEWAGFSGNGQLFYMDHMGRFWQPAAVEDQLISALDGQGSDRRFIIKNNIMYGINDDFQLWSYALSEGIFSIIGNLPDTIDYITDIHQQQLLLTMRIAARKDVVELSLH